MRQIMTRWSFFVVAVCVLGPMAGMLTASLRAHNGGPDASLLVSTTPERGVLLGLAALALSGLAGAIAARLTTARDGLTVAGLVLVWAAARTGRVDVMLRATGEEAILWRLCIEGAIVGLAGILIAALIYAIGKPREQVGASSGSPASIGAAAIRRSVAAEGTVKALPAALVAGGVIAWLVAAQPMKGQAIAAAFAAGLAAAAAARLLDQRTPAQAVFVVIGLLAAAGPASAFYFGTGRGPVEDAYTAELVPLARIMPLDWVAGALLGVPWGLSWASSASERHGGGGEPKKPAA